MVYLLFYLNLIGLRIEMKYKTNEFEFTIVGLNCIEHKLNWFILVFQAKESLQFKNSPNHGWWLLLTSPQRILEDDIYEDEIWDMFLECDYGVNQRRLDVDA